MTEEELIEACIKYAARDWKEGRFGINEKEIVVDVIHFLRNINNEHAAPVGDAAEAWCDSQNMCCEIVERKCD